ncbi:uncharacterized protein LOC131286928 [Anopheles ziemanni]|uniref:uncharacterized protein LOC131272257 n=1 Tax=Anopheles coustani TaxID=139045 RepID=UPI00265A8B79|nr:uncharacterized protein LOC131272257 [Anopheles coustani]XP_058171921.1 uncharacterized protein LOC131286928 [Anopheles ziemanni]
MSAPQVTNVEKVLPNDEELGRRNCRWRELVKKYEKDNTKQAEHEMDIDAAFEILDQEMSNESSVSDVEEDSSKSGSAVDNPEDIKQQLRVAVPSRKRTWEVNGLKEILDDHEFRMLSHEKVENWLRNHMHSITGQFNVHYQAQQVTTVTETCMDADADSLYSVDTAQYIRSNKQISNKVKVTTMIKQYAVTSSIRHGRLNSLGSIYDDHSNSATQRMLTRAHSKSDSSCDVMRQITAMPPHTIPIDHRQHHQRHLPQPEPAASDYKRRTRKKVFKKTLPRKRPTVTGEAARGNPVTSPQLRYDQREVYEKALEQCARMKKAKARRTPCRRVTRRQTSRMYASTSSSEGENRLDDSDNNDVFRAGPSQRVKPILVPRKNLFIPNAVSPSSPPTPQPSNSQQAVPLNTPPPATKSSPTEREIVEPFQSITLSASKRKRPQPAGPAVQSVAGQQSRERPKKQIGIQLDGCYHDEGIVIYRPKTIRPHLGAHERILLRMEDLTLDGVVKERHLVKFRDFNYRVHPNSTVCFYPSDSDSDDCLSDVESKNNDTENSYDDDDPILTFHPRKTNMLNVVEVPYRRRIS